MFLAVTLAAFGGISTYAFFTRRDFSFLRGFLMVGTIVLLVALVIGFAVDSLGYHLWISVAGVLLFSGFVLLASAGVVAAPIVHRVFHRFHVDDRER